MPSKHLVDPELLPLLGLLGSFDFSDTGLAGTRKTLVEALAGAAQPIPAHVEKLELHVPGPPGSPDVRVLVHRPRKQAGARAALLNIHGGGYVSGVPEMQDPENARLAAELGMVVVSPDYRLAPEAPYPAALEDCYATLSWMVAEASSLGLDPQRIAVSGESAGGGLAAALALLARDKGDISIAFQRLIYPMLDDRTTSSVAESQFLGQFVWTRETNAFGWSCLLGDASGGLGVSAHAAAARAENLAGLPPTFIACGALDIFIDENMDYARRLMHAGVPTELHVYPGAPHGFTLFGNADVSRRYDRDAVSALQRALGLYTQAR